MDYNYQDKQVMAIPQERESITQAQKIFAQHLDECHALASQLEQRLTDVMRSQPPQIQSEIARRPDERIPMSPIQSDLRMKDLRIMEIIEILGRIHNRLDL